MHNLKELIKVRADVKRKYETLKLDKIHAEDHLEKIFKPITEPLKDFINVNKNPYRSFKVQKEEKVNNYINKGWQKHIYNNEDVDDDDVSADDEDVDDDDVPDDDDYSTNAPEDNYTDKFYSQTNNTYDEGTNHNLSELSRQRILDKVYGPYENANGQLYLGNKKITITNDKVLFEDGQRIALTPGLYSLIFLKKPHGYDDSDLTVYKEILFKTNAHKRNHHNDSQSKGTRSDKYKKIIMKLIYAPKAWSTPIGKKKTKYEGAGLMDIKTNEQEFEYMVDPNEIVDRLRPLFSSDALDANKKYFINNYNIVLDSIIKELENADIIEYVNQPNF